MCDNNIEIGVTEITNNILISATPTDQIIDINVLETTENVELTITPSVVEVNIDVTQNLITEVVTVDANTCVNIVDVVVTDATENVVLNITPSLVEVNINRGENNLSIAEYDTFADLPTVGNTDTYYITLDANKFWRWDAINEVYVEISDSDDRIPYLGAIKNSDLGEWGIKTNWLGLDTTPTNPPTVAGTMTWNDSDGTADLKLKGGNVTLQIGQESVVRVVNKTGATLNEADFRAVRVRSVSEGGAQGQRLAVLLAQGSNDMNSATTIGIVTESIADNQEGFITTFGNVSGINTTGAKSWASSETWLDGDILYLSPDHAGYLTKVKPVAPQHAVTVGYVVYAHANNGKIFAKVDNGFELDELHNVLITSPTNNQGLVYDSTLDVWKNAAIQLPLSATSPLSIASNVISISQATATTDGYVTSADWNYFSAKQQALSGTGFVKIAGSTISYDNTIYTPQSRVLTINGTAYDLSADRSWSISVGSGMRNVSSFIATAGQTTFTIVGGYTAGLVDVYVNGARLNASDYTATNGTTVVLATGLVANDIVDIINYVASLTSGITGSGTSGYIPKWSGSSNLTNSTISETVVGVGINTPAPRGSFEVLGNIYSNNGAVWVEDGQGFLIGDLDAGASYAFMSGVGSTGAASYLTFHTNYLERLRIIANGNIGVGMTNPTAPFHVTGLVAVNDAGINIDDGYQLVFARYGNTEYASIEGGSWSSTTNYLRFITTANEAMRIIANGSVGIGLTNPAYKLDVVGDVNITGTYRVNGVAIASGTITGSGTANYITKWSGTSAITNSLIYDNGTNVGIGTTSPDTYQLGGKFVVAAATSAFYFNDANNRLVLDGAGTARDLTFYFRYSNSASFQTDSYFKFLINSTEAMRITSNGKVGIGTTNPTEKLNVYTNELIWGIDIQHGYTASNQYYVAFRNSAGSQTGNIQGNGTTTSYNITSDYRLKEDLKPIKGLEQVSKINVYDFKFKNSSNRMDGVLAHELQEVLPFAVTGIKDGKDMQSVDYSKIVPILVQAIKELNAKLEAK